MAFEDARSDRTALRLRLLQNGFEPIPLRNKMPLFQGWNTLEITEEVIKARAWARNGRMKDTGIRCGDVIAIDFDIDDQDVLDDLIEAAHDADLLDESHVFIRYSKRPRELWVFRTNEPFSKRATGKYDEEMEYQVEILGKGNQFAAFGLHTSGIEYSWPYESLLDAQYRDLPEITLQEADALIAFAAEFFTSRGLKRITAGATGENYKHVYDLKPNMTFNTEKHGAMSVDDMLTAFRHDPTLEIRCGLDPLVPGCTNLGRCEATAYGINQICISDHGEAASHFLVGSSLEANFSELQELVRELIEWSDDNPTPQEEVTSEDCILSFEDSFETALTKALQRFAFLPPENLVVDVLDPFALGAKMPLSGFRTYASAWYSDEERYMRGIRSPVIRLGDSWALDPDRQVIFGEGMRPDRPGRFYQENGKNYLNTYRAPAFVSGGNHATGMDFMRNLLPDNDERQWFLQWLKHKIDNPHIPGPGVVMVAPDTYGSGRGTLFDLLRIMFGAPYVNNIDFSTLSGGTYQSQYNEWQENSLVVLIEEAKEKDDNKGRYQQAVNVYERLKTIIDPRARPIHVLRKGASNSQGLTFASIIVATNHSDALVIPQGDRRIAVLTNGGSMTPEYWAMIHDWLEGPGNVGAFVDYIRATVSLDTFNPYAPPPMTRAKEAMIEAGISDLDRIFREVVHGLKGRLISHHQLVDHIESIKDAEDVSLPDRWEDVARRMWKVRTHALPKEYEAHVLTYDGHTTRPRAIHLRDIDELQHLSKAAAREELAMNASPVTRKAFEVIPGGA